MKYSDDIDNIFYRENDEGNADILYATDGEPVTSINENVYPVGSSTSAHWDHPEGIILTISDAMKIGIPSEY